MLTGKVNSRLEAVVRVWIRGSEGRILETKAVIDTGFSGALSLPREMVAGLGLLPEGRMRGILADGSEAFFPIYRAIILWHGQPQATYVSVLENHPLLGMGMLHGSEFAMQIVEDGEVFIRELEFLIASAGRSLRTEDYLGLAQCEGQGSDAVEHGECGH